MSNATTNGRLPRKQLANQLDRLDSILDGLSDALNEAVADAAREGSKAAVKEILTEILTNPQLRAVIAGMAPAASGPAETPAKSASPEPSLRARFANKLSAAKKAVVGGISAAAAVVNQRCRSVVSSATASIRSLAAMMPLRKMLLVGLGIGAAVGLVAYLSPPLVSAVAGGAGGAAAAVAVQVGAWFRRSVRAMGLAGTV